MSKLNPAVRTGLIWAGGHQAWALLALVALWTSQDSLMGLVLLVADCPVTLAIGALGLPLWHLTWLNFLPTSRDMPEFPAVMVWVLTFGAAQWFLIGYAFVSYVNRRGSKQR